MRGISTLTEVTAEGSLTLFLPNEATERRWPSMSQEVKPHQAPDLLTPRFWIPSLQN